MSKKYKDIKHPKFKYVFETKKAHQNYKTYSFRKLRKRQKFVQNEFKPINKNLTKSTQLCSKYYNLSLKVFNYNFEQLRDIFKKYEDVDLQLNMERYLVFYYIEELKVINFYIQKKLSKFNNKVKLDNE